MSSRPGHKRQAWLLRVASPLYLVWPLVVALALLGATVPWARASSTGNLRSLTLSSPALGEQTHVNVLLPNGYAAGSKRYPVLYLLHGYADSYAGWAQHTDITHYARNLPLIVVMPDGDSGWYMNPSGAGPKWETYHIDELIPYIDGHFRTIAGRNGRAIAGLSMGGMGAFAYAARHPDLFVAAASFSGVLDPARYSTPWNGTLIPASQVFASVCGQSVWCLRAHDPVDLAANLRGVHLFLSSGDGKPGPLDRGTGGGTDQLEVQIHKTFAGMVAALHAARVPAVIDDYGSGTHSWPYWQRELHLAMPMLVAALTTPQQPPASWSYRTADPPATVWGYTLTVHRADDGFTDLSNVGPWGFTVTGRGTVSIVTAAIYKAGHPYAVSRNTSVRTVVHAGKDGRLHITALLDDKTPAVHVGIQTMP